jgi:hypothetical protein
LPLLAPEPLMVPLPAVELPEAAVPDVELPLIELPDAELPDVELPVVDAPAEESEPEPPFDVPVVTLLAETPVLAAVFPLPPPLPLGLPALGAGLLLPDIMDPTGSDGFAAHPRAMQMVASNGFTEAGPFGAGGALFPVCRVLRGSIEANRAGRVPGRLRPTGARANLENFNQNRAYRELAPRL